LLMKFLEGRGKKDPQNECTRDFQSRG
jgi:hypothetical protein